MVAPVMLLLIGFSHFMPKVFLFSIISDCSFVYTIIMALYLLFNQGLQRNTCPKICDGNRVVLIVCDIVDQYFTNILVCRLFYDCGL